ncbi:MAG: efflux RND transporter permease subunit [Gammaproteobacteria bacterium]
MSGETAAVSINVFGPDLATLDQVAAQLAAKLREMPDAADVQYQASSGVPTLSIALRADRLGMLGLRAAEVLDVVTTAYAGTSVAQVYEGNQSMALRVLLNEAARSDPLAVRDLLIRTPAGRLVPLGTVADIELESGPRQHSSRSRPAQAGDHAGPQGRRRRGVSSSVRRRFCSVK